MDEFLPAFIALEVFFAGLQRENDIIKNECFQHIFVVHLHGLAYA